MRLLWARGKRERLHDVQFRRAVGVILNLQFGACGGHVKPLTHHFALVAAWFGNDFRGA
jgi:hypothetical protein